MQLRLKTTALFVCLFIVTAFLGIHSQAPAHAQTQAAPQVIAIGDSVTDDFGNGGWRGSLQAKLASVGQAITYVGTRTDVAGNHEAYGGATSCDFFTDRSSSLMADMYGKSATWDFRTSLAATSPSIAIIDIGINNYVEDYSLTQGLVPTVPCGLNPQSLQRLWDAVVYYPGITGVVITTVEDAAIPNGTENVNVIVRKYVADRRAQGKNVCLGAVPTSLAGLTVDRFHLSAAGKDAVAAALVGPTRIAIAGSCATASFLTQPPTTAPVTPTTAPLFGFSTAGALAVTSADAAHNPPFYRSATGGLKFTMTETRTAYAIRFWKTAGDTATSRTVGLYSSGGALLASGTSSGEASSGWVSVPIQPTTLNNGATYVAAVFSPTGAVAYQQYFHTAPIVSSSAVAPVNAGVYTYGSTMMFPTFTYLATTDFIDVDVQ